MEVATLYKDSRIEIRKGDVVKGYRIRKLLGEGAFCVVFETQKENSNFALKLPKSSPVDEYDMLCQQREENILHHLSTNFPEAPVIRYREGFWFKRRRVMILDLATGCLEDLLSVPGFNWSAAKSIIRQCLRGLAALNDAGVVHCDLKPDNLMTTGEGVCLADFNCSKWEDDCWAKSYTSTGTLPYTAPETIVLGGLSHASDVWAFGCICVEMLTGEALFSDGGIKCAMDLFVRMEGLLGPAPTDYLEEVEDVLEVDGRAISPRASRPTFEETVAKMDGFVGDKSEMERLRDFLTQIFVWEADDRASANELLAHPLFTAPRPPPWENSFDSSKSGFISTMTDVCDPPNSVEVSNIGLAQKENSQLDQGKEIHNKDSSDRPVLALVKGLSNRKPERRNGLQPQDKELGKKHGDLMAMCSNYIPGSTPSSVDSKVKTQSTALASRAAPQHCGNEDCGIGLKVVECDNSCEHGKVNGIELVKETNNKEKSGNGDRVRYTEAYNSGDSMTDKLKWIECSNASRPLREFEKNPKHATCMDVQGNAEIIVNERQKIENNYYGKCDHRDVNAKSFGKKLDSEAIVDGFLQKCLGDPFDDGNDPGMDSLLDGTWDTEFGWSQNKPGIWFVCEIELARF